MEENSKPLRKAIIGVEEPDCVDVDGIGNVEDLPRRVFLDEECENLKVVVDGGELTRNINKKKKPVLVQAYDDHSVTNAKGEIVSSLSMWNIVN